MAYTSESHDRPNHYPRTAPNGHRLPTDRLSVDYDRPNDGPELSTTVRRVTVPEAAEMLGTTTDAVRSRMRRGKLRREEGEDGTVYVLIEGGQNPDGRGSAETGYDGRETGNSTGGDGRQAVADSPLVERMASEIDYLRSQLDQEREANRENRRLLAAALERIPELEAPREPPPDEPGAPMRVQKDEGNGDDGLGPQEPSEHRSWLYRFFFGP
jgi:hypothetical protein